MMQPFDSSEEKPSKSQRKREVIALQKLGEMLVDLPTTQLAKIPLPHDLAEAIYHAQSLKSHEAKRRQLQYIGKLMREIDPKPIKDALKKIQFYHQQETEQFHHIEQWRDELIAHGNLSLQKFVETYPETNRQTLRQLIRKAQFDQSKQVNTGGASALFDYLRRMIH